VKSALFKSQALVAYVARAVAMAASFGLSIAVARTMSIENAGRFFAVLALVNGAATVGRFGLDNLALREVSVGNVNGARALRFTVLPAAVFSALSSAGVALLGTLFLGPLTGGQRTAILVVAALTVPASALAVLSGAIHRAQGRVGTGTMAELGSTPILVIAGLVALFWRNNLLSIPEAWIIYCIGAWLTAAWSLTALYRAHASEKTRDRGSKTDPAPRQAQLAFLRQNGRSLVSFMTTSLSFYLLTWAPVLILGAFGLADQTAYYNVAARVAAFVSIVPSIQASYLSPVFARLYASRQLDELGRIASSASLKAGLVGAAVILPILFAPRAVLGIFGGSYIDARTALYVLSIAALAQVLFGPLTPLMMTCRLEAPASYLTALAVALSFGVGALVSSHGATAIALVTASLSIAYSVACFILLRRRGIKTSFLLPLKGHGDF
jgi:O-antigen/teichoic acid export membrane protein